ncbi:hypothetical protein GCM10017714_34880 [Curtobacterium pusillum]|nr:hypothetical protein GCM10017610_17630 [Curtobacterium pusillum]
MKEPDEVSCTGDDVDSNSLMPVSAAPALQTSSQWVAVLEPGGDADGAAAEGVWAVAVRVATGGGDGCRVDVRADEAPSVAHPVARPSTAHAAVVPTMVRMNACRIVVAPRGR